MELSKRAIHVKTYYHPRISGERGQHSSQYDLVTDLLCDGILEADDCEDIDKLITEIFGYTDAEDVLSAVEDFQD